MWTRKELKDKAKVALKQNYWKAVLVGFLLLLIGGGFSGGVGSTEVTTVPALSDVATQQSEVTDEYYYDDDYYGMDDLDYYDDGYPLDEEYLNSLEESDGAFAAETTEEDSIPVVAAIIAAVTIIAIFLVVFAIILALDILILNPFLVGIHRFFLRNLNQKAEVKELTYAFDNGNFIEIVKTMFLRDLFIALWTLLFIIPGIVKSYEYRMIPYLLAEDPTMTKDRAFAESKRMMTGQKWNAFVLDLSFLGWNILSVMTLGFLSIFYVGPYQAHTNAALYEKLRYGQPAPAFANPVPANQPPVNPFAGAPVPPAGVVANAAGASVQGAEMAMPQQPVASPAPLFPAAQPSVEPSVDSSKPDAGVMPMVDTGQHVPIAPYAAPGYPAADEAPLDGQTLSVADGALADAPSADGAQGAAAPEGSVAQDAEQG